MNMTRFCSQVIDLLTRTLKSSKLTRVSQKNFPKDETSDMISSGTMHREKTTDEEENRSARRFVQKLVCTNFNEWDLQLPQRKIILPGRK